MRTSPQAFGKWLILFFLILIPTPAWANTLTIVDVETPANLSPAEEAKVSVYFDLRQGENQTAITGINTENCQVLLDGKAPEVVHAEMRDFTDGDRGVGVLFVFPIAKNYSEESFAIRTTLTTLIQMMNRPIDMVNAIAYDVTGTTLGWTKASEGSLVRQIHELQTTDVLEPNLFSTFSPAISVLDNLQNVSQKYLVFISDAEGALVGERDRATPIIAAFNDQLKKSNIKPVIIGYSPDGAAALSNVDLLKRIATSTGGVYYQAESLASFQQIIQSSVYNYIFKKYIYDATLNMDGGNYLDPGKYSLQLVVKTSNSEDKAAVKITWPQLKKNRTWLWVTLLTILLAGVGVGVFIAIRRGTNDDEEYVDEGPQEVVCSTCGKTIPTQLYGFKGEFCLSGGLPDCPYYQMPDRGKVTITKGVMADTTFFIKKEITTIGCRPENDIYLADASVSRKHAAIKADDGMRYEVRDFGSSNGLYVNNEKVERKFLKDGDLLRFGAIETIFKLK